MSLRNPFPELATGVLAKSDLQSVFCLLVFCIVSLVLAYLTNPTENSFRTYLTEQSFRHHLSRLDDHLDNEQGIHDGPVRFSRPINPDRSRPFHFANRASVSLRTPKHVFHSFAIFTIAAMIPVQKGSPAANESDRWSISDSWYIGAFGKWWRGGVWETWYQDVISRSKDEESWSSGILSIKNLDMLPDFRADSYTPKSLPFHLLKQSPPRLRNRDYSLQKMPPPRNSSPPPLSKSASLPLHAKRLVPAISVAEKCDFLTPCLPISSLAPVARSSLFDQSPLIAEVLRQISASTASVQDLRSQYSEYQASAVQSRDILNAELESHRERKRHEDASRSEMKSKTKMLDDQKRTAEGLKREAERKFKAVRTTQDSALHRIKSLDEEVASLEEQTRTDRQYLSQKSSDTPELELRLSQALELKKTEIRMTEEALLTLNRRSRELEEKLLMERERLEVLKRRTELRINESASMAFLAGPSPDESHYDKIHVYDQPAPYRLGSPSLSIHSDGVHHQFATYPEDQSVESPSQYEVQGYPSNELDLQHILADRSASDRIKFSRSRQLNSDTSFNQAWRSTSLYSLSPAHNISTPANLFSNLSDAHGDGPSQVHDFPPLTGTSNISYPWAPQEVNLMDEMGYIREECSQAKSTHGSLKSGLNPGAKEFSLPRKRSPPSVLTLPPSPTTFDALNPNGLSNNMRLSASSTSGSLLRAFAPSRAEREALQRALGGSTNSSLERLPSLSEVGSIPSSPSHVPASALKLELSQTNKDSAAACRTFNLPSWLTVLPGVRKTRFKPWDDDEPVSVSGEGVRS